MTRIALDSNILLYAEIEPETAKGRRAAFLIESAARDGVIPVQVLGEFLRVVQRRFPDAFGEAIRQAAIYETVFLTPATTDSVLTTATATSLAHGLQLWDAIVCAAAQGGGATVLLSENLQDGRRLGELHILNPFAPKNAAAIAALLKK